MKSRTTGSRPSRCSRAAASACPGVRTCRSPPVGDTRAATAGFGGERLPALFDNALYSVAAGLAAPIFNAGALVAGRHLAVAQKEELLANYHGAIVAAFGDVERSLNAIHGVDARLAASGDTGRGPARARTRAKPLPRRGRTAERGARRAAGLLRRRGRERPVAPSAPAGGGRALPDARRRLEPHDTAAGGPGPSPPRPSFCPTCRLAASAGNSNSSRAARAGGRSTRNRAYRPRPSAGRPSADRKIRPRGRN